MILAALMFVFGAWNVQQLAQLPSLTWLACAFFIVLTICITHANFASHFQPSRLLKASLLCAAAFLLGVCWASGYAYWRMSDELPHEWEQESITVEGVVASVPEVTERGVRFRFDVENVMTKGAIVPKHISLNQYRANQYDGNKDAEENEADTIHFHAGERWLVVVKLKRPHGTMNPHGLDFESWALAENVRATGSIKSKAGIKKITDFVWQPSYLVERFREQLQNRISRVLLGKPYVGILHALVMGDDSQISVEDWQVFLRTGTSHLMSISGLHITMLAALAVGFVSFFWRRSPMLMAFLPTRKAATAAGAIAALAYALIAGFSVPSQRTVYMLFVFAVALWSGRRLVIAQVLAMALFVVVLLDPWAVISPGFWLSFGAVAMLAYALGGRIGEIHWFKAAFNTQYAVTLGMLPLLLVMFGQASIISPIANAFAIPLISFVVAPLALLGSFISIDLPLHLAYKALEMCMAALKWLNLLSLATWQQHEPAAWTFIPAMFGVVWLLLPRGFPMRCLGLLGFIPVLFIVPQRPAMGDMKVTVLDVGQGLSVAVQTQKHDLVYDAGPKFNKQSDAGSRIVIPFLRGEGINSLSGLVVSHNDIDHSGGMLSVLTLMPVRWLASSLPKEVELPATQNKLQCYAGQHWRWDGVLFEILYPTLLSYNDDAIKDNDRSCVLKITSVAGSVLLTGDIEKPDEIELLNLTTNQLKSDVLVVPHHGSKTSSTPEFIAAVAPSVSIFTNGYLNRFGHPKPLILERYKAKNRLLYRSDYNGAIEMDFINQRNIKIVSWRNQEKRYWHDTFEATNIP